jgi:PAS domain-containing protein
MSSFIQRAAGIDATLRKLDVLRLYRPCVDPVNPGAVAPLAGSKRVPVLGQFMHSTAFRDQFTDVGDACALAQGIVDTVREPVLVLDAELCVVAASRSFYSTFKVSPENTQGRHLYALGNGQWDIPKLRELLDEIIPQHGVMEDYEVEHEFPDLGHRRICLNARQVFYEHGASGDTALIEHGPAHE